MCSLAGGFGALLPSYPEHEDISLLRQRMSDHGYVYLPGLLEARRVAAARASVISALEKEGSLEPGAPREQAVARKGLEIAFRPDLANGNAEVEALLYTGRLMEFWARFLGGEVRHFDFTWLRAKGPGADTVTPPHCDTVFMNRGTPRLFTAWTPLGDVPFDHGGLMILEGSHRREDRMAEYWSMDVDTYCANGPEAADVEAGRLKWETAKKDGVYRDDPFAARDELGGRWLTTEFKAGDVLIFGMFTVHAAADNRTARIRLSTDSRYQLASEPADHRWVGPQPVAHSPAGKLARIC